MTAHAFTIAALVCFLVAAILAGVSSPPAKGWWPFFLSIGLACLTLARGVLIALVFVGLSGCAQLEDWQEKPSVKHAEVLAGSILLSALGSVAQRYANGGALDNSFAIGVGLDSISQIVRDTVSNQQAARLINSTAREFSKDPKLDHVAMDLAHAYVSANPVTPSDREAVVLALGKGITNTATNLVASK